MNPQILRRVEDPCRTQRHMRRGIGIPWEGTEWDGMGNTFRYHSSDKSEQRKALLPYLPYSFPHCHGAQSEPGGGACASHPSHVVGNRALRSIDLLPLSAHFTISAAGNTVLDVCCGGTRCGISPAVLAHVLGRSCHPPGITGLSAGCITIIADEMRLFCKPAFMIQNTINI